MMRRKSEIEWERDQRRMRARETRWRARDACLGVYLKVSFANWIFVFVGFALSQRYISMYVFCDH